MSGVVGIYSKDRIDASNIVYYGLYAIQHRGQISAGIAVNNNGFMDYFKDLGLVHEVFTNDVIDRLRGNISIGHVRYDSTGQNTTSNAQPLVVGYRKGALSIAHDGSLVNFKELKDELEDNGSIFQSQLDTEVIANLIAKYHDEYLEDALIKTLKKIVGSYSFVLMTTDKLIGARDPFGIKPLVLGKFEGSYIIASETCAFDTIGAEFIRDIEPGEIIIIDDSGIKSLYIERKKTHSCLFEIIYFSRPDSLMDNKSIYQARIESGRILARESFIDGDLVIGAPDSGTIAAIGYAEESKIPYSIGLVKNRYIGRTFIQPTQDMREKGVRIKLNVLKENIVGKRIVLVDDSIVRGTTMKRTVKMIKEAGAREVHVRVASPAVVDSCHLGINTNSREHLIGGNMTIDQIRQEIGADSLAFLSLKGLVDSAGGDNFCTGCLGGKYPILKGE